MLSFEIFVQSIGKEAVEELQLLMEHFRGYF